MAMGVSDDGCHRPRMIQHATVATRQLDDRTERERIRQTSRSTGIGHFVLGGDGDNDRTRHITGPLDRVIGDHRLQSDRKGAIQSSLRQPGCHALRPKARTRISSETVDPCVTPTSDQLSGRIVTGFSGSQEIGVNWHPITCPGQDQCSNATLVASGMLDSHERTHRVPDHQRRRSLDGIEEAIEPVSHLDDRAKWWTVRPAVTG